MLLHNPVHNPMFVPTLRALGVLFLIGFGLVIFFGRRNLIEALRGELGQRTLSWFIIAALFLAGIFLGEIIGISMLVLCIGLALREYQAVLGIELAYRAYLIVMLGITTVIVAFFPQLFFALPALAILVLTLIPILSGRIEEVYSQMSYAGRGYFYIVWSLFHASLLYKLPHGPGLLIIAATGAALSDVGAYTVGKLVGKHRISPSVSPSKAYEGIAGDVLGAGLALIVLRFALPPDYHWGIVALLAVLIGIGSAWGDLVSSLAKRASSVKDWGKLLPGHGGVLDRANSLIVVIPIVYYFSQVLELLSR